MFLPVINGYGGGNVGHVGGNVGHGEDSVLSK